jgi:hypothetical protein
MVYDYFRKKLDSDGQLGVNNIKAIYQKYSGDIEARFQIRSYNSFRLHVNKGIDYERQYGNSEIKKIVEGL